MDMIRLFDNGVTIQSGKPVAAIAAQTGAKEKTIAAKILAAHDHPAQDGQLHITFDGLISHDITYVGIIQTARASGLTRFPVPYVLTNCHNSLCAVGGTINEDDHVFGLSAAIKYGGDYVPANQAVIHQYAREMMTGCGKMLLGSDSHTRYGAIGTMGIGEGGPELVKQLLQNTYDVAKPQVVLVWLTGEVPHGVGPHDVAIALCGAVYKNGLVKNLGEIEWVKELCPRSKFYGDAYDQFGMFGGGYPCIMAHCVHSNDAEQELMLRRGVYIAHSPESNMNLASGVAPVNQFIDRGLHVGLATDIAGGSHESMLRAMMHAIQASKLRWRLLDQSVKPLSFERAFYLATMGGGQFFGKVGSFLDGYELDAVVLDDAGLEHPQPLSARARLERMVYLADERNIAAKFVSGRKIL